MVDASWPVVSIPTPEQLAAAGAPSIDGGILLPLRWTHHGDLRIVLREPDQVFISVHDLHAFTGAQDHADVGDLREKALWWQHQVVPGRSCRVYPLSVAVWFLESEIPSPAAAAALLEFLREALPLLVRDEVLDAAIGLRSFLDAWTVQQAAVILSRVPGIDTGRTRLFGHMESIGWIDRESGPPRGAWAPTRRAVRAGWLTIRQVRARQAIDGRVKTLPYDQIYVTPEGLDALRSTLNPHQVAPLIDDDA